MAPKVNPPVAGAGAGAPKRLIGNLKDGAYGGENGMLPRPMDNDGKYVLLLIPARTCRAGFVLNFSHGHP